MITPNCSLFGKIGTGWKEWYAFLKYMGVLGTFSSCCRGMKNYGVLYCSYKAITGGEMDYAAQLEQTEDEASKCHFVDACRMSTSHEEGRYNVYQTQPLQCWWCSRWTDMHVLGATYWRLLHNAYCTAVLRWVKGAELWVCSAVPLGHCWVTFHLYIGIVEEGFLFFCTGETDTEHKFHGNSPRLRFSVFWKYENYACHENYRSGKHK